MQTTMINTVAFGFNIRSEKKNEKMAATAAKTIFSPNFFFDRLLRQDYFMYFLPQSCRWVGGVPLSLFDALSPMRLFSFSFGQNEDCLLNGYSYHTIVVNTIVPDLTR